ncbi:hypothetical protein G6F65_022644 [Rhizopus arrhizus]|nr:hypothetical protein G6F65_022644 [Rhizopus arrhizus]
MIGRASNPDDVVAASNTRASSSDWAAVDSDDMPHGTCPVGVLLFQRWHDDHLDRIVDFQPGLSRRRGLPVTHPDAHDTISVVGGDLAALFPDDRRCTVQERFVDLCTQLPGFGVDHIR